MSLALQGRFFTTELPEKPLIGFLQEVFAGGLPSPFTVLAISVFFVWLVFFVLDSSLSEFSSQLSDNSTVCLRLNMISRARWKILSMYVDGASCG